MDKKDFIGVEKGVDASSLGMEEKKVEQGLLSDLLMILNKENDDISYNLNRILTSLRKIHSPLLDKCEYDKFPTDGDIMIKINFQLNELATNRDTIKRIADALQKLA